MLSEQMQKALNEQIAAELFSAYLYLAMSAWFQSENLGGFAHWMDLQAREEQEHAMRICKHIYERRGRVILEALDAPQSEWKSPLAAFEAALGHEEMITGRINALVNQAIKEKDHATNNMLQWFVSEQVEEEEQTDAIVQKLRLIQDAPRGMLLMLDRELAARGE